MKFEELKSVKLLNDTVLLDVSHVKTVGDEERSDAGLLLGYVQQSEVPTYGYVVAAAEGLDVKPGDIVPIAQAGTLRVFDWPGKPKTQKILSMRLTNVDGVIRI